MKIIKLTSALIITILLTPMLMIWFLLDLATGESQSIDFLEEMWVNK